MRSKLLTALLLALSATSYGGTEETFNVWIKWNLSLDSEGSDVPPLLSSTKVWSPIPREKEIGREEAIFGRTDHRLPA
jgi:hypothetical protein